MYFCFGEVRANTICTKGVSYRLAIIGIRERNREREESQKDNMLYLLLGEDAIPILIGELRDPIAGYLWRSTRIGNNNERK